MILHLNKNENHFSFRCSDAERNNLPYFAKQVL